MQNLSKNNKTYKKYKRKDFNIEYSVGITDCDERLIGHIWLNLSKDGQKNLVNVTILNYYDEKNTIKGKNIDAMLKKIDKTKMWKKVEGLAKRYQKWTKEFTGKLK